VLLLGDQADQLGREGEKELDVMATRLVTMLATLNEFPVVRWEPGTARCLPVPSATWGRTHF
jgi:hypothetical protein